MTAGEMAEKLGWKKIVGTGEKQVEGCYIGDMLSRVMGSCGIGAVWVTVQSSLNMVAVAEFTLSACVLLPEGVQLSPEVAKRASEEEVTIYSAEAGAFEAACAIASLLEKGK